MGLFDIFRDDEEDDFDRTRTAGRRDEYIVETNAEDWGASVNVTDGNPLTDEGWFRTHTISLDDAGATAPASDTQSGARTQSGPRGAGSTTPRPSSGPKPRATSHPPGTFVFPNSVNFMQKLEARGLNGAHKRVETVYVLAGDTPTMPVDLFRLDDQEYYVSATPRSVRSKGRKMARKVASLYPDGTAPGMLARFHTHPSGGTKPSHVDKENADMARRQYEQAFDSDDFEFFQGIHAYKKHDKNPGPTDRHDPSARSNTVAWVGEQYRHELALFGPKFRDLRQVVIEDVE